MRKEKSCGCIVFNEENRVLLVNMKQGHWSFPKGHVEEYESEYETAYREVFEETHINCEIIEGFRHVSTYSPYPGVMKDVVFFIAVTKEKDIIIQAEEINSAGFYEIEKARKLITYKQDFDIFNEAVKFITKSK